VAVVFCSCWPFFVCLGVCLLMNFPIRATPRPLLHCLGGGRSLSSGTAHQDPLLANRRPIHSYQLRLALSLSLCVCMCAENTAIRRWLCCLFPFLPKLPSAFSTPVLCFGVTLFIPTDAHTWTHLRALICSAQLFALLLFYS
jgi:hypothetical protein